MLLIGRAASGLLAGLCFGPGFIQARNFLALNFFEPENFWL
jgi:hypothetical protein